WPGHAARGGLDLPHARPTGAPCGRYRQPGFRSLGGGGHLCAETVSRPTGASMSTDLFRELALAPSARLEQLMHTAPGPTPESLAGFEWRGYNRSWRVKLLGLQKFVKGFFQASSGVEGYNIPVQQNGLD